MTRSSVAASLLGVLLISACAPHAAVTPEAGDVRGREHDQAVAQLRDRESSFFAAQSSRDAAVVAAHYADDATLHVADMPPVRGREALVGFYSNLLRFLSATTATPETLSVSRSGDLAYTTGSVTNVFEGGDGRVEYPGKYVLVWERRGGDWEIVLHGVSSNGSEGGGRGQG